MKQYYFLIALNVLSLCGLKAQNSISVEKKVFKINMLVPGLSYEHGLDQKNTLYSEFQVGFGYREIGGYGKAWSFYPSIEEQFRHYYNLDKRNLKGKVTQNNSGAYVGALANYSFESLTTNENFGRSNPSFELGAIWGFQRTYKHIFNINMDLGLAHFFGKDVAKNTVSPIINFSLGWVIK